MARIPAIIVYDQECALCRQLALFVERRARGALRCEGSGECTQRDSIGVICDSKTLWGREAWAFLLENYRDLKSLNWLAAKLGIVDQTATVLMASGALLKRICRKCGKPLR